MSENPEKNVTLVIDGKTVTVPVGTNLIEAAATAGVTIPHYCYHKHLSVAGNCRMCQVQVEGERKQTIACNTSVRDGMVVHTQESSAEVADSQRAVLEFLLINHPLDCTVCDQAGHCKLQDYYYDYNSKPSRFTGEKVNKVKAEPLGPEVILDGERCILCTRCVRFCEEVTETSELCVLNRGDQSVIAVQEGRELTNPLAGSVVDLCPVGALTHRRWRFNSRIWYTSAVDTVCTGCSTGCNVKAYVRDGQFVQIKARLNSDVNEEWMCDEGRYGFARFQPESRLTAIHESAPEGYYARSVDDAMNSIASWKASEGPTAIFLSPFLTLEEVWLALQVAEQALGAGLKSDSIAMQVRVRELTDVEAVLISPDYAPNARSVNLFGIGSPDEDWRQDLERSYERLLARVRDQEINRVMFVGDFAVADQDIDSSFEEGVVGAASSIAITSRGLDQPGPHRVSNVLLPGVTVNEKSGVMVNRHGRLQRLRASLQAPAGSMPDWLWLKRIAASLGSPVLDANVSNERELFRAMVKQESVFDQLTMMKIGESGITLDELVSEGQHAQGENGVSPA